MPADVKCCNHTVHLDNKLALHKQKEMIEGLLYCPHLQDIDILQSELKQNFLLAKSTVSGVLTCFFSSIQVLFSKTITSIKYPYWLLWPVVEWRKRQRNHIYSTTYNRQPWCTAKQTLYCDTSYIQYAYYTHTNLFSTHWSLVAIIIHY